jgi:hypothetical protein
MNQEISVAKKKEMESPSTKDFYLESLKRTPGINTLLVNAKMASDVKAASDFSYSASSYASPRLRIAGDAGCFIDPFFSSGVHLAFASGLSAAVTICAAMRGDCEEHAAVDWHSHKVADGYTRFLLVVLSVLKQIREKEEPVLNDWNEDGFDRAFAFFRPSKRSPSLSPTCSFVNEYLVIQGTADVKGELSQSEISKTVDFCMRAFQPVSPDEREGVHKKVEALSLNESTISEAETQANQAALEAALTPDELSILNAIRARQMIRSEDTMNIDNFSFDTIDGLAPNMKRGSLGLVPAAAAPVKLPDRSEEDVWAKLIGEV